MRCPSCRYDNPLDGRFCEQCGSLLDSVEDSASPISQEPATSNVCPKCEAETRPGAYPITSRQPCGHPAELTVGVNRGAAVSPDRFRHHR